MTAEEGEDGDAETAGRPLDDPDEFLYRQVHPAWIVEGEPSSQAFKPTRKDDGMLSIALGSRTTAQNAFLHHTQVLKLASGGTWAVSVSEALTVGLTSFELPLEDSPAHGFIDFRNLSRRAIEVQGKAAVREGPEPRLHAPTIEMIVTQLGMVVSIDRPCGHRQAVWRRPPRVDTVAQV